MNLDFSKKLIEENPLTVDETYRLDQAIEGQAVVSNLVAGLEDSAPSLAWRSDLNQRLLSATGRGRRRLTFRWVSGFAAAAALVGVAFFSFPRLLAPDGVDAPQVKVERPLRATSPRPKVDAPSVEESLLTAHREADLESGMGISFDGPPNSDPGSL